MWLHSLLKTSAMFENSRAGENPDCVSGFHWSTLGFSKTFASVSPNYEGTENMFYFLNSDSTGECGYPGCGKYGRCSRNDTCSCAVGYHGYLCNETCQYFSKSILILLHRYECFTVKQTTRIFHTKLHPGYEWDIFHILTSEDIVDVNALFFV